MVAFATDHEPGTTTVEPKNRVGNFFVDVPDRAGWIGPQTRTGTGENDRFSYDACRGVSLAQGGNTNDIQIGSEIRIKYIDDIPIVGKGMWVRMANSVRKALGFYNENQLGRPDSISLGVSSDPDLNRIPTSYQDMGEVTVAEFKRNDWGFRNQNKVKGTMRVYTGTGGVIIYRDYSFTSDQIRWFNSFGVNLSDTYKLTWVTSYTEIIYGN